MKDWREMTADGLDVGDWPVEQVEMYAERVGVQLAIGEAVVTDFCPGNGTRYQLLLMPLWTTERIDCKYGVDGVEMATAVQVTLVTWQTSYPLHLIGRGWLDPGYVQEKLKTTQSDAWVLARLLMAIGEYATEHKK